MGPSPPDKGRHLSLEFYVAGLLLAGTALLGASLAWNIRQVRERTVEEALTQARVAYSKDILYRRWNNLHGGVYVTAGALTPPNSYLTGFPERDVVTPSGKLLTLVNPAYMTRQVYELEAGESGLRGHITSLNPLRPQNAPDPWERDALRRLERGTEEVSAVLALDGREYLRLMKPLITEEGCLACHQEEGYVLGRPWGGISISVPMQQLRAVESRSVRSLVFAHLLLWALGLVGLGIGGRSLLRSERELRLAEEDARGYGRRLEESNRLKDLFIDIVRHDLLNPASVVRYYVALLSEGEHDADKKGFLQRIEHVNNRLIDLIRNASKYSRLEEMDRLDCQTLDLNALLLDALAQHEATLKAAGIAVHYLPRGEYPLRANPMLEDVFSNLVANSAKYGAEGKRLDVEIRDLGTCWLVLLRDFGKGIPDEHKSHIFTRFTRLKKEGVEGSGLGLAIVKRLVDLHKGRIWVEDNPEGGAVFCVRLPKHGPQGSPCADG